MSLQNLAKIGNLHPHKATAEEVARLISAIERNLKDASRSDISSETRFDCAYKAIMQCALIAMMASGYRPSTSAPGHHQTMIQSLPLTLGVDNETWVVLDALRKKRNQNDYTGAPLSKTEAEEASRMRSCSWPGCRNGSAKGTLTWWVARAPASHRQGFQLT